MILPENYHPKNTIVFFDEIQQCPEIVTKIKFLVDEGSFKYVMSGSLLGVELKGISSAPVGYLSILRMFPMDFEEFMIANDVSQVTLDMLKKNYSTLLPIDSFIHEKLLTLFFTYLIVGGMPDAIKTYVETKDIRRVDQIQKDICAMYRADFTQYEKENKKLRIKSIYDIIPAELNKQDKRFIYTMLDKELKFNRYENSFLWLQDAGVVIPVYNTDAPCCPLLVNKRHNLFRLFSNDIGLLTCAYPLETKIELINKNGNINNGAHFENAMAQQLCANGLIPYYCKKKKIGELDFVIELNGKAVAIEVKSGKDYKKHNALNHFLEVPDYHLDTAYVFSCANIEKVGKITYLPIYMSYLLIEKEVDSLIVDIDTSGL